MSYSVLDAKNDLTGVLHGTTINKIQNIDGVFDRAARALLLDLDPQETMRAVEFVAPVFNTVYDYPLAADVKGNKIIDIRPQVRRLPMDIWTQQYSQAFDVAKSNVFLTADMFNVNFNTGLKTIRVNAPYLNPPIIINQADSITDNGTWAVGGTASNLAENNTNFVQGAGSLQFDATVGAAYLQNSTSTAVDLSDVENQAYQFVNVYVPTGSDLTSIELRWGSSASNYWTSTVTLNQQGTAFVNGWNLCQFVWSTATTVGSPNAASVSYVRVTLNLANMATGCLVNGIDSILGTILEYLYYSKYLFRDGVTGAFQERVTADSNLINLDTESYNLFFNLLAWMACQQQQGFDAAFYDGSFFKNQYDLGLQRYQAMYKAQNQKPQSTYYWMPNPSNSRFIGRGFNS